MEVPQDCSINTSAGSPPSHQPSPPSSQSTTSSTSSVRNTKHLQDYSTTQNNHKFNPQDKQQLVTMREGYLSYVLGRPFLGLMRTVLVVSAYAVVFSGMLTMAQKTNNAFLIGMTWAVGIGGFCFVLAWNEGAVRGLSIHYVLMICGSGGHTAEMIQMVEQSISPEKSSHRRWAVGKDDEKSYNKILAFETRLLHRSSCHSLDPGTFDIVRFGRARYVHQSWLTTPFTALLSLVDILHILTAPPSCQQFSWRRVCPGVVVTNGPGTGFLFLLVAQVLRRMLLIPTGHMRAIYVESWARVKSLSLTGRLIKAFRLADLFIVQQLPLLNGPNIILSENLLVMPEEPRIPFDD